MFKVNKAKITKFSGNSYVKVRFYPDLQKFGLTELDQDHYKLFQKRAYDISGTGNRGLKVFFNKHKLSVPDFRRYINYYDYNTENLYYDESNKRWKVGCLYFPDNGNRVVSFVNCISTYN